MGSVERTLEEIAEELADLLTTPTIEDGPRIRELLIEFAEEVKRAAIEP